MGVEESAASVSRSKSPCIRSTKRVLEARLRVGSKEYIALPSTIAAAPEGDTMARSARGLPKDATASDIAALKNAGIPEDDIVRLSELIAFVNYQVRVLAGLRLMAEAL